MTNRKRRIIFFVVQYLPFSAVVCLSCYLLTFRMGYPVPEPIFWIASLLGVAGLILTSLISNFSNHNYYFMLLLLLVWLIKSVFVPTSVPLFGSDPYISLAAANQISEVGWLSNPPWASEAMIDWPNEQSYPALFGIALMITKLTGLQLEAWARWGMLTLSLLSILLVYGIAYSAYRSRQTAALSAVGFGFTYYYLMFHSQFVRESLAFIFFLSMVYATIRSEAKGALGYRLLAMTMLVIIVLTHHLTAVMSIFFLLLYSLSIYLPKQMQSEGFSSASSRWSLMAFASVVLLLYWIYLRYTPIRIAQALIEDALHEGATAAPISGLPPTLRYLSSLILQVASTLVIGVIGLYGLLKYHSYNRQWQVISVVWGALLGLMTILGYLGLFGKLGSFPSRMEVFGYVFLLPAAAHTIVSIWRTQWVLSLCLSLALILHAGSALIRITPQLYSDRQPDLAAGETNPILLRQEYGVLTRLKPQLKNGLIGVAYQRLTKVVGLQASYIRSVSGLKALDENSFGFIMIGNADQSVNLDLLQRFMASPQIEKIYDAGSAEVYVPAHHDSWGITSYISEQHYTDSESNPTLDYRGTTQNMTVWYLAVIILIFVTFVGWIIVSTLSPRSLVLDSSNNIGNQGLGASLGLLLLFVTFLLQDLSSLPNWIALISTMIMCGSIFVVIAVRRFHSLARESWKKASLVHVFLPVLALVPIFLIIVGAFFNNVTTSAAREPYTEFYIKEVNQNIPSLSLGVRNRGINTTQYRIEVWTKEAQVATLTGISIKPDQEWVEALKYDTLGLTNLDEPTDVTFYLFEDTAVKSDHTLRLLITRR